MNTLLLFFFAIVLSVTGQFGYGPFGYGPFGYGPFGYRAFGYAPFGYGPFRNVSFGYGPFGFGPYGYGPYMSGDQRNGLFPANGRYPGLFGGYGYPGFIGRYPGYGGIPPFGRSALLFDPTASPLRNTLVGATYGALRGFLQSG